jgi:hypothetical protein
MTKAHPEVTPVCCLGVLFPHLLKTLAQFSCSIHFPRSTRPGQTLLPLDCQVTEGRESRYEEKKEHLQCPKLRGRIREREACLRKVRRNWKTFFYHLHTRRHVSEKWE